MTEIIRRVVEPIVAAQDAGLDRLLAETLVPSVSQLVEAFAGPLYEEVAADEGGNPRRSRLIVTTFGDPAEETRSWTGAAEETVRHRYLTAFGRALPEVSQQELWFRMRGILAVVAVDRVDVYNQPCSDDLPPPGQPCGPTAGHHLFVRSDERATVRNLTSSKSGGLV